MLTKVAFWVFGCILCALPVAASAPAAAFVGRWEGAIVMREAESEVDLVIDLEAREGLELAGELALPLGGVSSHPLLDVRVDSNHVSFEYRDDTGSSIFDGHLSQDGDEIQGEMREGSRVYAFYLVRSPEPAGDSPGGAAGIVSLSPDDYELRARFNEDAEAVRIVLLVSPTCTRCLALARLAHRYVMERVEDDRLRMYVIWLPVLETDSREAAVAAAGHLPDGRVTQFWALDAGLGRAYHDVITPEGMAVAYDVLFVYGAGTVWPEEGLPEASSYMHQLGEKLPADRSFNGLRLAETIRGMLEGGG